MPYHYDDHARRHEQGRRQRIMDGTWRRDAYEYLRRLLGAKRLDQAWGGEAVVDTSTNILREDAEGKATLYDRPPRMRCIVDGVEVESASRLMNKLLDAAQYATLMQDVLAQVLGLNDYCVRYRVKVVDGVLVVELHPTSPAMVLEAIPSDNDPRQPVKVCEEWHFEGKPVQRVWTDELTYLQTTDGTLIEGTELEHGQGACPWILYHVHGRPRLWLPHYRSEVVESTYRVCMAYSYLDHNLFEASWSQRYTIGLAPAGADAQLSLDGTSAPVIDADPTSVLQLEQVDESRPGSAGQFKPGADPEVMGRAVARLHGRATLGAGGSDLAVYRKSGNAESAYAMAITREMQREAQIAMAPRMAPSDRLLVSRIAAVCNLLVPGVFPADSDWRVRYYALPPSSDELDRLGKAVEMGVMTQADLRLAVDPFASPDEVATADDGEDVPPVAIAAATDGKASDVALNGAQVQSAQGIVSAVAAGQLPRESGVSMLVNFFNLPPDSAEQVMGDVGRGFVPTVEGAEGANLPTD
jgi:hypothetical protein